MTKTKATTSAAPTQGLPVRSVATAAVMPAKQLNRRIRKLAMELVQPEYRKQKLRMRVELLRVAKERGDVSSVLVDMEREALRQVMLEGISRVR